MSNSHFCSDCEQPDRDAMNRRDFVKSAGTAAAAATAVGLVGPAIARTDDSETTPENLVEELYNSLAPAQKEKMCFDWDHEDERGLLRTHVSNNWNITDARSMNVGGSFYTSDQKDMIEALFFGLYSPEWHDRIRKQLQDDAGGYGRAQSIAIFGEPGTDKFEFVMTGRHLTIRCDGDSAEHGRVWWSPFSTVMPLRDSTRRPTIPAMFTGTRRRKQTRCMRCWMAANVKKP